MVAEEFERLEERFYLTLRAPANSMLILPANDLLQPDRLQHMLRLYGSLIHTEELDVSAAFFCSWYAGICCAVQKMLARSDGRILDLSLANLTVHLCAGDSYPSFLFEMNDVRVIPVPGSDRRSWRKSVLFSFYAEQARPLIESLSKSTRTNGRLYWGQIVNAIYAQYDDDSHETSDEEIGRRIVEDYRILSQEIEASAFGLRGNPFGLKPRFIDNPIDPNRKIVVKAACCLAYRLNAEFGYCYSCPRLKDADRVCVGCD